MAQLRTGRVRHARMGRLVQQSKAAGADRKHSAGRSRSALLCATRRARHRGVTQTKRPPANPGRFTSRRKAVVAEKRKADTVMMGGREARQIIEAARSPIKT